MRANSPPPSASSIPAKCCAFRGGPGMLEPLYTADEMRAAEAGHDVPTLMERAGRAVADAVLQRFPAAQRIVGVCGGGANGGAGGVALNLLKAAGRGAQGW